MPSTITAIYSFNAGHTALSAQLNTNFDNMRGHKIPLDLSLQSAVTDSYDLGRADKRWQNIYYKGQFYQESLSVHPIKVGGIIPFFCSTSPTGYLLCDGSSVSRTTYSDLFEALTNGTSTSPCFGFETSTNFNLPDLRGKFIRGVDNGSSNDPDSSSRTAQGTNGFTGDTIGSIQTCGSALPVGITTSDTSGAHSHTINRYTAAGSAGAQATGRAGGVDITTGSDNFVHIHSLSGGDSETRPLNLYCNYYIRY